MTEMSQYTDTAVPSQTSASLGATSPQQPWGPLLIVARHCDGTTNEMVVSNARINIWPVATRGPIVHAAPAVYVLGSGNL